MVVKGIVDGLRVPLVSVLVESLQTSLQKRV